jgi:hypothetical protein
VTSEQLAKYEKLSNPDLPVPESVQLYVDGLKTSRPARTARRPRAVR